ncbi:hypothetical protein V492_04157 [Pseudogymnoascus sp. VKM F-4246]|nr:hypothetical protein V492_04157 [Pseudogymnoascus sp. VKM F-4246]
MPPARFDKQKKEQGKLADRQTAATRRALTTRPPSPQEAVEIARARALHDDGWSIDVSLDSLVRQDRAAIDVDLIGDRDVVSQDRDVLKTRPLAYAGVPSNDSGLDPGVVLDLAALEDDAALEADAVADDDVGADGDVGADAAVAADLGGGVDQHVAAVHVGRAGGREKLGVLLAKGGEVEAGSCEEVFGLADVHPEALEVEGVELAVLAHRGEGLLLDGGGAELDALEDAGVEDVEAGVDAVADELDGLLDEAVDARVVVGLVHDDSVLGGLLDLGHDDGALIAVGFVEGR